MRPKNVETLKELIEENFTIRAAREDLNNYEVMGLGRFGILLDLTLSSDEYFSVSTGLPCLIVQCSMKS
jgi:hypothetical protein